MKFVYSLVSILIVILISCSDNVRNNPLDPESDNTIIGSISGKILPTNVNSTILLKNGSELIASKSVTSNGVFGFKNLKEGNYTLLINANNYNDLTLDEVTVIGSKNTDIGAVILTPISTSEDTTAPRAIFGKVIDTKSLSAIENVQITASGGKKYTVITNSSGTYSLLDIDAGQYNVTASKDGYLISTTTVNVGQSGGVEANFSLGPIGIIKGKVTGTQYGNSLENVLVSIEGYSTYTNSTGQYILSGIQEQFTASISFEKTEYIKIVKSVDVIPGSISNLDVQLTKFGTVKGKVTNSVSGVAIAGISVVSNYSATTTDANGNYELNVIPGNISLLFSGNRFVSKTVSGINVSAGTTINMNVLMQSQSDVPTATVSGIIRDAFSGQNITISTDENFGLYLMNTGKTEFFGYSSNTINNGYYSLTHNFSPDSSLSLTPNFLQGEYLLTIYGGFLANNNYLPYEKNVTLIQGANTINIDLIKGAIVVGNVSNSLTGSYIINAMVTIGTISESTDNSGDFRLAPVDPVLNLIKVTADGYYSQEEEISLQSNQTSFVPILLTPKPSISGTVTDSNTGSVLSNVLIEMGSSRTTSNTNGSYLLPNLAEGKKVLSFAKEGYKSFVTSVSVPYSGKIIVNAELEKN